ncbi:DUF3276 family protein [uncultured Acetobacteroides sp.]|uniref:DUF3276 family protein n=1 Tax=uncultured Acetobacteroides sp. TaxID=1760811 RepID=UPI0029F5120C|nr:DUF3276 family protein [uncultured Acetobacteroides sp.]
MIEYDLQENKQFPRNQEEIYTDSFRAGKRTYFFDVKATRQSELYITITESKRSLQKNGKFNYEKHHIYLFKEDLEKFANSLNSVVEYVKQNQKDISTTLPDDTFTELKEMTELFVPVLDFEDLDR